MKKNLIQKYKPKTLSDFFFDIDDVDFFNNLIKYDELSMLIVGCSGSGKSTLLNVLLNEYYNKNIDNNNILYINNLKEKSINYYKNEIKTFCNNFTFEKNKKTLIVDDIDFMNEKKQHIFRYYIDNYKNKINFIFTCTNMQNVIGCIQSRLLIHKLSNIEKKHILKLYKKIKKNENIIIEKKTEKILLKNINNSMNEIINYMEKFLIYNEPINNMLLKNLCSNLSFFIFKNYTKEWYIKKNFKKAIKIILNIYKEGYSIIDILNFYYIYIKKCVIIEKNYKFKIIKIISKYINIFYTLHEKKIELYFFTNELINIK